MIAFEKKQFDIEHALLMHANSYAVLPAAGLYDKERLKAIEGLAKKCHIYLIGHTPRVFLENAEQVGRTVRLSFKVNSEVVVIDTTMPEGSTFTNSEDGFRVTAQDGKDYRLDDLDMAEAIRRKTKVLFNVLYVGQAYGKAGERAALTRLEKHETLQKIALQEKLSEGSHLMILLLEIVSANRTMTLINPFAEDKSKGQERIRAGLDKLFNTSEKERVALYEASLIRYFQPKYNKEFKDSFPSTNMKVLKDCYDKDFSGVVAEICFDDLPWNLTSDTVPPTLYHIAKHSLHTVEARAMFFGP